MLRVFLNEKIFFFEEKIDKLSNYGKTLNLNAVININSNKYSHFNNIFI